MTDAVLVVEDEPAVRTLLISQVSRLGYPCWSAESGFAALERALHRPRPALVLTDVQMPDLSGIVLLARIRQLDPEIQVVMVSAVDRVETLRQCRRNGAYAYLLKPYSLEDLAATIAGALAHRRSRLETERRHAEIDYTLRTGNGELRDSQDIALLTLAKLAESRDGSVGSHLDRIRWYSRVLAQSLASGPYRDVIDPELVEQIGLSSQLHDIGKVAIPDHVLNKPGSLTAEERTVMRSHTTRGGDTLRQVIEQMRIRDRNGGRFLGAAMDIAYSHHERWDGMGYPHGLRGRHIPLAARIVTLADAYDAMTSARPYKTAWGHTEALRRIAADRGRQFDPVMVDAFLSCERHFDLVRRQLHRLQQETSQLGLRPAPSSDKPYR